MKNILLGLALIVVCSCNSSKKLESKDEPTTYTQVDLGYGTFMFKQHPESKACSFNTKSEAELIQFIELDHSGDRDDKLPRKINTLPDYLSRTETEIHSKKLSLKICYTNEGAVVAFSHDEVSFLKKLHAALFEITYEGNTEDACVVCKSERFYVEK